LEVNIRYWRSGAGRPVVSGHDLVVGATSPFYPRKKGGLFSHFFQGHFAAAVPPLLSLLAFLTTAFVARRPGRPFSRLRHGPFSSAFMVSTPRAGFPLFRSTFRSFLPSIPPVVSFPLQGSSWRLHVPPFYLLFVVILLPPLRRAPMSPSVCDYQIGCTPC